MRPLLLGGCGGNAAAPVLVGLTVADVDRDDVAVAVADVLEDETEFTSTCCPLNTAVAFIQEFFWASNKAIGSWSLPPVATVVPSLPWASE